MQTNVSARPIRVIPVTLFKRFADDGNRVKMTVDDTVSVNMEHIELTDKKLCKLWKNGIYKVTLHAPKVKTLDCQCVFEKVSVHE